MKYNICILEDNKICDDCGRCDICDINPEKTCDNCGLCIEEIDDYLSIDIDSIDMNNN